MLTNEEKEKIRLEEQYRIEVRNQISKEHKKSGLLTFLNSNFGSFLLSTVIVGGMSFLYSSHQERLRNDEQLAIEQREKDAIKDRLLTETSHRLATLKTLSDSLLDYQSKDIYLAALGNSIGNDPSINARFYNFKSYYREYSTWTTLKLIGELVNSDNSTILSELKSILVKVDNDIVDLSQEWYPRLSNGQYLGKRERIRKTPNGAFYGINANGERIELSPGLTQQKRFYIGDRENVQALIQSITTFQQIVR